MVNTFLVSRNFQESAKILDYRRLGKQRVEAMQILNILLDIEIIKSHLFKKKIFTFPFPETFVEQCNWYKDLKKSYSSLKYKLYTKNGINEDNIIQKEKEEGFRLVLGGFSSHPAVFAWLGCTEALKYYINVHIEEWISRGYKNNMKIYEINTNELKYPWWVDCEPIRFSHIAALLNKERDRNENEWYVKIKNKDFINVEGSEFMMYGYIWPSHLNQEDIEILNQKVNFCKDLNPLIKNYAELLKPNYFAKIDIMK